jgi:hypothetical protein
VAAAIPPTCPAATAHSAAALHKMCRKVACLGCAQPTWEGCGQHIEGVLSDTPPALRCPSWSTPDATCGFVRQRVPNDGNCLYTAIDLAARGGGECPPDASPRLRALAAATIAGAPETYTPEVLGAPTAAYLAALQQDTVHGGEVELTALSAALALGLAVVDLTTPPAQPVALRLYNAAAPRRAFLVYTGTHYDALRRGACLVFEEGATTLAAQGAAACALGERLRAKGEGTPKMVKRVRCSACAAVMEQSLFQAHCQGGCPSEDCDGMCEDVP